MYDFDYCMEKYIISLPQLGACPHIEFHYLGEQVLLGDLPFPLFLGFHYFALYQDVS